VRQANAKPSPLALVIGDDPDCRRELGAGRRGPRVAAPLPPATEKWIGSAAARPSDGGGHRLAGAGRGGSGDGAGRQSDQAGAAVSLMIGAGRLAERIAI